MVLVDVTEHDIKPGVWAFSDDDAEIDDDDMEDELGLDEDGDDDEGFGEEEEA